MSSKLRKLKQQAYEAGRKRDWVGAAEAYAQILEQDKNNPSLQNEYGDVCLKTGDTSKAVRQFLTAAAKYRQTGLLNNAQAVYKKVLRHEPGNVNANWFLAEIRAAQGLIADGVHHSLTFLAASSEVSGELKEIFLKRCLELFNLYPESEEVLEKLEGIFRVWNMPLEAARTGCLRACLAHQAGQVDEAGAAIAEIVGKTPEIVNYGEYSRWLTVTGGTDRKVGFNDFNTIELDGAADDPVTEPAAPAGTAPEPSTVSLPDDRAAAAESQANAFEEFLNTDGQLEVSERGSLFDDEPAAAAPEAAQTPDDPDDPDDLHRDEEGCISIDLGEETNFSDLLDEAAASMSGLPASKPGAADEQAPAEARVELDSKRGSVNLLAEILAEEGEDILRSSATEQVSTIASEIGRNLGESAQLDPESQYQQGLVYLELGLHDQAILAFTAAARTEQFNLQAREMWGIALQRDGHAEAALAVLQEGLAIAGQDDGRALGLLYHAGRILEELGRQDEAQEHYRRVHSRDAGFADVVQRLRTPVL